MITSVRTHLRVLLESILVTMFMTGEIKRERDDWNTISARLPLRADQGCSLGLVAKTYFDQVTSGEEPSEENKDKVKSGLTPHNWFRNAKVKNLGKSLDTVHSIWDAVYAGSQEAGRENKAAKAFDDANATLKPLW
jgi:hypothetical protein